MLFLVALLLKRWNKNKRLRNEMVGELKQQDNSKKSVRSRNGKNCSKCTLLYTNKPNTKKTTKILHSTKEIVSNKTRKKTNKKTKQHSNSIVYLLEIRSHANRRNSACACFTYNVFFSLFHTFHLFVSYYHFLFKLSFIYIILKYKF